MAIPPARPGACRLAADRTVVLGPRRPRSGRSWRAIAVAFTVAFTVAFAVSLPAGAARAASPAASLQAEAGHIPKDFCIVHHEGVYHAFYIRHPVLCPGVNGEVSFGHATSVNLFDWTHHPPVLHSRPEAWDDSLVWAPHVVESDGVFYLFYTGVTYRGLAHRFQRLGLATSTDLFEWNRVDLPVLDCMRVPWAVCDSTSLTGGEMRDPFAMPDPIRPGRWLLYYVTHPAAAPDQMLVGVAATQGGLETWVDLRALWNLDWPVTYSQAIESPHLLEHGGLWYLFYTTNSGLPINFQTCLHPYADAPAWSPQERLSELIGGDPSTNSWVASETFRDPRAEYFCVVNWARNPQQIEIREMAWRPDGSLDLIEPRMVRSLAWSRQVVDEGDTVTLLVRTENLAGERLALQPLTLDGAGSPVSVDGGELGLPETLTVTGDVTTHVWRSSRPRGVHSEESVLVRSVDWAACSAKLSVRVPYAGGGGGGRRMISEHLARPAGESRALGVRWVRGAPVPPGEGLLVSLPAAAEVDVDLIDVAGRRVRSLASRRFSAGATLLLWDGRTEDGVLAAPGVYLAIVRSGDAVASTRVVRVR
jgi:hypothetical protein